MRPTCEPSGYAIHVTKNGPIKDNKKNSRCEVRMCYEYNKKHISTNDVINEFLKSGEE
jgi:hypothetical protein